MTGTTASTLLQVKGLSVQLDGAQIVDQVSLQVGAGEVVGVMGPNGCGKSTLVRTVYRAQRPSGGAILLDGEDLSAMSFRRTAQSIAALPQDAATDLDFTVEETVAMGRVPHTSGGRLSARERALLDDALAAMGIDHLRQRGMLSLSGGERQRVLIARALVQQPRLLVLDEPTNHLDLAHQIHLLALLRELNIGVLVVLHDLNFAAAVCDRICFVRDGRVVATGRPENLLEPELIREVFNVDVSVVPHPLTSAPQVLFQLTTSGQRPKAILEGHE